MIASVVVTFVLTLYVRPNSPQPRWLPMVDVSSPSALGRRCM